MSQISSPSLSSSVVRGPGGHLPPSRLSLRRSGSEASEVILRTLVLLKGFDLGRSLGEIFYKRVDNYIYISSYSLDILVFFSLSLFFFLSVWMDLLPCALWNFVIQLFKENISFMIFFSLHPLSSS